MFAEEQWVTKGIRAEGVDAAEGCGHGVAADERVEVFPWLSSDLRPDLR